MHCLNQLHALIELVEMLRARQETVSMSKELNITVLKHLERVGSLEYTRNTWRDMNIRIETLVDRIEVTAGWQELDSAAVVQKLAI
jgi:hypothetical protein